MNELYLKRFFVKYRELLDIPLMRKDYKGYVSKVGYVGKVLEGIDFERNILFICNKDLMREVFLCGFMNLNTLRSYDLLNINDFMGIHLGNRSLEKVENRDDDVKYEDEEDIVRDVLCVTCNYYEIRLSNYKMNEEVLISTIMNRYNKVSMDSKKPLKLNWIYGKGTINEVDNIYGNVVDFFKNKIDNPMFSIIDLNSLFSGGDGKVINNNSNSSNKDNKGGILDY